MGRVIRHGSLFSGIGGFDLAAEWLGWDNVFHCEWAEFQRRVLKYHFPNSISYDNIKTTDFTQHRGQIDVISGGFPCQPFSIAGKRKGADDDRYLWDEMLRAIREIQPTWVVGENVAGLMSMVQPGETVGVESEAALFSEDYKAVETFRQEYVLETICRDLEREGYAVQPLVIPACAVGAPHRRDRLWIVAHCADTGPQDLQLGGQDGVCESGTSSDPYKVRGFGRWGKGGWTQEDSAKRNNALIKTDRLSCVGFASYTHSIRGGELQNQSRPKRTCCRHELFARKYPVPNWDNFPTQSPICGRDDGISSRLDGITFPKLRAKSIEGYGNAVVPQLVYEIFKAINNYEYEEAR